MAPAAAIVGFADIVIEDAERAGLSDYAADLDRIRSAGLSLQALLDEVLQQSGEVDDIVGYRTKLRHDLRTPINAVKGYGEMIVEDARDSGHDSLLPDLEKLLAAADGILERIDALVAFSGDASIDSGQPSFADASRVVDALAGLAARGIAACDRGPDPGRRRQCLQPRSAGAPAHPRWSCG